jgi:membrane protease YdiL (CAAX protease family)
MQSTNYGVDLNRGSRPAKPWLFLALWIGAALIVGLGVILWGRNVPSIAYWARGAQGFLVSRMVELLLGIGIIVALQRPKSTSELREMFYLPRLWTKTAFCWLCVGVAFGVVVQLAPSTWHGGVTAQESVLRRAAGEGGLAYYVAALLLCPIPEEMIMRAYLYEAFRKRQGQVLALSIISVLTVLQHLGEIRGSVFSAYRYAGLGLLLCYAFNTRRNLIDSIACHVGYNAVVVVVAIKWVVTVGH